MAVAAQPMVTAEQPMATVALAVMVAQLTRLPVRVVQSIPMAVQVAPAVTAELALLAVLAMAVA